MIFLNDFDHTYIPENVNECVQLAVKEYHNTNYDIKNRDYNTAALNRYYGKLAEAQLCMTLRNVGFIIVHGVRVMQKFADSGADLVVQGNDHVNRPIQIKTCGKYINFFTGEFTTAMQNAEKLCRFAGPIIIKRVVEQKVSWYCTDGEEIKKNLKPSQFNSDEFFAPTFPLVDKITDFGHSQLLTLFEKHSKPYLSEEFRIV